MFIKSVSLTILVIFVSAFQNVIAQNDNQQLELYKQFLNANQNMNSSELLNLHPGGNFKENLESLKQSPLYLDSIDIKYSLTADEKFLLDKHGFVVTERLSGYSFGERMLDIYHKDLPVFVSTDAILHAFHCSYDRILKDVELGIIIDKLKKIISDMHSKFPELEARYSGNENIKQMLMDADVYLTVPGKLLDININNYYSENSNSISELLSYIEEEQLKEIPFFSTVERKIDFSQFKPRGHYTDENYPELAKYFKGMIWFGKMEIYLIAPETAENIPTFEDVQRQIIDAALISELVDLANVKNDFDEIEKIISSFVGDQDNVTLSNLNSLIESVELSNASELLDSLKTIQFQDSLITKSYAFQRILSQVLMNDPYTPDSIKPASAFMLFGQRFIVDSYVTGNVVFDKIKYNGEYVTRMLPSTLDILYSLGNNASAQLLKPELDKYHYSTNIAALRYLVDSYDDNFWESTIYNSWLNSIRTLNPPEYKNDLPAFMQTAAWWQQKMNTQLASWTELRHDNLLYAKQSYTGGIPACSYPYSYVEPIPAFFEAMKVASNNFIDKINNLPFYDEAYKNELNGHFNYFHEIMDTLKQIAQKELNGNLLTEHEKNFLKSMLTEQNLACVTLFSGWYPSLFYSSDRFAEESFKMDFLVADYHTAPTDKEGNIVGWVAHSGTGPIDMIIVNANLPNGESVSFVGPVMSYYEYTTNNFMRLTDEEWKETWQSQSLRPDWTNLYLADNNGEIKTSGAMLITGIEDINDKENILPETHILARNYPNPFNNGTIISFIVPQKLSNSHVELIIYNIQGEAIKKLVDETLPGGNYLTRWEGRNEKNNNVASGVYFYEVKVGNERFIGKMNLMK